MMTRTKTLEDWITEAWAEREECPPPEIFLPTEWESLTDEARDRATRHLEACRGCSAERDLAAAFEAPALANPRAEGEMAAMLDRIGARPVAGDGARRVVPFPSLSRVVPRPALTLAAAALLVVAAGVVVRSRGAAPALPEVPVQDVVRSGRIDPLEPMGDTATPPAALAWRSIEGAATYRVTLTAVDDTELWSGETSDTTMPLPAAARAVLRPRVVYFWRVEAFDSAGERLAWSAPTRFRFLADAPLAGERTPR